MDAKSKSERILKELGFDFQTFTIENFIRHVSEAKGRQIVTTPWKMPATLFGAWLSDGEEPKEYIFYRNNVPLIHQVHIQLHELSHLLFDHPTLKITRKLIAEFVKEGIDLPFDGLFALRSPDKTEFEIEAETLASLVQERVIRYARLDQLTHSLSSSKNIAKVLEDLGIAE